jgi:gliding motility-associated-like protein
MKINFFYKIILGALILFAKNAFCINPPTITATDNQIYCPGTYLKIAQTISITPDPAELDTDAIYIQIAAGYVNGQDQLILANPTAHSNITTSWDAAAGKLKLYSPVGARILYTDFVSAIKDVEFSNSSTSPSGIRNFSITIGQANYLPSTEHYYQYVPSIGITWTTAKAAAEASNYYGLKGYLATLSSLEEAKLCGEQASGAGWIGGTDEAVEGVWRWVTGPEGLANGGTGIIFWNGVVNGSTPNFAYWNLNEPNQFQGSQENYAHITAPGVGNTGTWNDLTITGNLLPGNAYQPKGYIVEYGGMPSDPVLQISASTTITILSITSTTPNSICGPGTVTLQATASAGTINWYDALTGGNLLGTGTSFPTPNLTTTTPYYVDASNGNCPNVLRTEVVATINTLPSLPQIAASSTSPVPYCLNGTAIPLAAIASANCTLNWYTPTGGISSTTSPTPSTASVGTTSYYVSQTITGTNCEGPKAEILVTVYPLPTAPSTSNKSYCNNETAVPLTATASANCTLNWYLPIGGISSLMSPTPSTASVGTTSYYVSQTLTATGCEGPKAEIIVTVYPIITINEEVVLCQSKTVTLDASISGMSYLWSPGNETSQTIDVSSIGDYSVIISSPLANCSSKKEFKVIEHPKPKIKQLIVDENSITIVLEQPENYYEFSIDGVLFVDFNQFSRIPSGQYTAFVREKNGCNLVQQDFSIFTISKYFTPNNDGFNDVWEIDEMKNFPNSSVAIFNRYGKLLKQLNYKNLGWNGTFNGVPLPAEDYWYVLKLEDSKPEIKGHFSLKR